MLPQAPGQQDREGDLIQLNALPVGPAIDPEILIEAAVLALRHRQIDERAQRRAHVADGQQGGGGLHHVARPHQVVAAELVVAFFIAPGNAEGSDHRAGVRLVLVRQQEIDTALE